MKAEDSPVVLIATVPSRTSRPRGAGGSRDEPGPQKMRITAAAGGASCSGQLGTRAGCAYGRYCAAQSNLTTRGQGAVPTEPAHSSAP